MSNKVVVPRFTHGIALSISGSECCMPKGTICPYKYYDVCDRSLWKQNDNDFIWLGLHIIHKYKCMNGCNRIAYDFTTVPDYKFVAYIDTHGIANERCYPRGRNIATEGGAAIMKECMELSQISRS